MDNLFLLEKLDALSDSAGMDVSLIINRLGGANALARKLSEMSGEEIKPDAVYKWRQRRKIAWRWHRKIETLAAREGVELRLDGEVA